MMTATAICDICRSAMYSGGARIDMRFYDQSRTVYLTNPPIDPNVYDVCPTCRQSLQAWIDTRKSQCK